MYAATFVLNGLYKDNLTVASAADGTITATLPLGDAPPAVAIYTTDPVPTVPAGSVGVLIDTVVGAVVTEPTMYGAVVDFTLGASTIIGNSDAPQQIDVQQNAGPMTFIENGGTQPIVATSGGGYFPGSLPGADLYLLEGGSHAFTFNADNSNSKSTVVAAGGSASIETTGSAEVISLADGSYTVHNFAGGDTVATGAGNYIISEGNPFPFGSPSDLFLGSGTDSVTVNGGSKVFGGSGHATVIAAGDGTLIENGSGSLVAELLTSSGYGPATFPYAGQADTVFGGSGRITVAGSTPTYYAIDNGMSYLAGAADVIVGGSAGHNMIEARTLGVRIFGGGDGDLLEASSNPAGGDTIAAGGGAESVFGNGATTVQASKFSGPVAYDGQFRFGNVLLGGSGPDLIVGGPQHDTIVAGAGATTIATGIGGSVVQLGAGGDVVNLSGPDTLYGGAGSATVGAAGGDLVLGGTGAMSFANGAAASTVVGGGGSMTLYAGAGGGVFVGGAGGGNLLVGGSGLSLMYGGAGAGNVFQFDSGTGGADVIADFDPARDRVALAGFAPGTADAVLATATAANGSVSIVLPDSTQVTFYHLAALTGGDFVVV